MYKNQSEADDDNTTFLLVEKLIFSLLIFCRPGGAVVFHSPPTRKTGVQTPSEAGRPGHQAVIGTGFILVIMLGGYQ